MGSEGRARVALFGLLFATLLGFGPLLDGGDYWGPALLGLVAGSGVAIAGRRLGAGTTATLAASAALLLGYLAVVFRAGSTWYGLPTTRALAGLWRSLQTAAEFSKVDYAPVPPRVGYIVMIVAVTWCAATFGEIATFRWRRPLAASLAPVVLFAVVLVVGTDEGNGMLVVVFLGALLAYWGLESSHRLRSWGRWVTAWAHHSSEPEGITGPTARRMGAACIAAAVLSPMVLPSLQEGLVAWRNRTGGDGALGGGDPLVSLLPRLIDPSSQERFRVTTESPTYYRLVTLARFDGEKWHPAPDPEVKAGDGYLGPPPPAAGRAVESSFRLTGLGGYRLPVPANATEISLAGLTELEDELEVSPDTGDVELESGISGDLEYGVEAFEVGGDFGTLSSADVGARGTLDDAYWEAPSLSPRVGALVDGWIAGTGTPFERLVAIQDHLREDFTYSLSVDPVATQDYLTTFLTTTRAGYCQQFATAFALLARHLGYPARVVAGYLPGTRDRNVPNRYIVSDVQAHAWPEVFFDGHGWVRFEPTPRSDVALSRPPYTSPAASERGDGPGQGPRRRGGGSFDGPNSLFQRERALIENRSAVPTAADTPVAPSDPRWRKAFARVAGTASIALLLFSIAVPLLKLRSMRRVAHEAGAAAGRAAAAFARFESEATELASVRRPSESAVAYARRIAAMQRVPLSPAVKLAGIYEAAVFGARPVSEADSRDAVRIARLLRRRLWESASWWECAVRLFSPHSLYRSSRRSP